MVKWSQDIRFGRFWFCFCPNKKEWGKLMKRFRLPSENYPHDEDGGVKGAMVTTLDSGELGTVAIVTVRDDVDQMKPQEVFAMLAHEALHVVQILRRHMGEDTHPREWDNYALQSIMLDIGRAYVESRNPTWSAPGSRKAKKRAGLKGS